MQNVTRALFNAYVSQIALLNGVESATTQFTVDPVIEQKLEEVIKQGSEFLQQINVVPVIQQSGDKVGIGVTRTIAGRTDTTGAGRRNPTDPTDSGDKGRYTCRQTNFDYALRYAKLDSWRHKPEFQTLVRNAIAKQQGRDRIMIGWHGESAAATTDRVANPNLEDVNEGWLHKIRTNAPAHVLDDGDLSWAMTWSTKNTSTSSMPPVTRRPKSRPPIASCALKSSSAVCPPCAFRSSRRTRCSSPSCRTSRSIIRKAPAAAF